MFKKFGENPPAYAIVFSVIAMTIANVVIFYIEGKDSTLLSILVGAIIGALVFFIGMSQANAEAYTEKIVENSKLKTEIQKLESIARVKGVEKPSVQELHTSSFESFRGSLSEFEKQILNHFQRHTGHELLNNLYTANPEKHPEHWLVKIFNEVVFDSSSVFKLSVSTYFDLFCELFFDSSSGLSITFPSSELTRSNTKPGLNLPHTSA